MYRHIEVREEDKNDKAIGSKLFINGIDEPYASLDDIIANHITPMNDKIIQMLEFKYFKMGSSEDINEDMRNIRKQDS